MKIFVIGFGQAGGKIADLFVEFDRRTRLNSVVRAIAINTAKPDLLGLKNIPMEDRILIGESVVKGHGVGADNELGAKIAAEEIYTIQSAIDKKETSQVDAFLIIAGLGGGTGSGGAPVLARRLKKLYAEPVYALGILPAKDEGGLYALNAARSLMTLVKEVDSLFLFDNDAWKREGESVKDAYRLMNEEIVRRFSVLFGSGESNEVGQMVVDASEIINTLDAGGVAAVGYAAEEVEKKGGFLSRLRKKDRVSAEATARITSLTRRAAMGRLTIPCDITSAKKAMILVAGPPSELDRKGIEKSKVWIEGLIKGGEVRGGDFPLPRSKHVAVTVVFSGVTDVPRIKELQEMAVEAQKTIEELSNERSEYEELFEAGGKLKPLF